MGKGGKAGTGIFRSQWFLLLIVMILIAAFTGTINPRFFRVNNLVNILEQVSTLGVVASGATILIISGNFDISVGANIGLSSCVMAMLMKADTPYAWAVAAGLLVALLCSLFVGASSIVFKAPSFIISLAAIGVGLELGLEFKVIKKGLGDFKGIQRRIQQRGKKNGVTWIDDYGHHPTEIKMTLKAVRQIAPGRVVVLFQPHRYSRTYHLFNEFMTAFYDADVLVVADIYPAGEAPLPEVNSQRFCESLKEYGHKDVNYIPDFKSAEAYLAEFLQPGDVLLTLGAGDVWRSGEAIIKMLGSGKGI